MADRTKRESGFSLLEMIIAMALGMIVLGAAVQLYTQGVGATFKVSQRAEMQQDFRAASNMVLRDLSMAGAGLGNNTAIALPSAATPRYGCDQSTCHLGAANTSPGLYPLQSATPYFYGLLPGFQQGPTIHTGYPTDTITVAYTDTNFYLNCYTATVTSLGVVQFGPPASPATFPPTGCLPNGVTSPQAVNDSVVGLTIGDLVYVSLSGNPVVVEVTGAPTTTGTNTYSVPFANNDVLKMNQTVAGKGLNAAAVNNAGTNPTRVFVITYYIDNTLNPPRLMRQVSGHTPMPVAENVVYMQFNYDLFNDSTNSVAVACSNPGAAADGCSGASTGLPPNEVTKINIAHMAMNSTLKGAQGGFQGLDLVTSVSARDLTYNNSYPIGP
ncbi:MAG: prepilin-type N-terminal cleavage/methylation domain-containing protein [Terriglobales bacterium]|jgi:type II secretory pathway pseudopilin PulG